VDVRFTKSARRSELSAHEAIYRAIAAGQPDDAAQAMERHVADAARYYEKKFPDVMSHVVTWELYGL
jgi:DNA-binding FadR family transcriptional regulator